MRNASRHGLGYTGTDHEIGLHREVIAGQVPGISNALAAGMLGDPSLRIDHPDLAHLRGRVATQQGVQCLLCRFTLPHQVETFHAVAHVDEGLRGHGTDTGPGPGHQRADRKPV